MSGYTILPTSKQQKYTKNTARGAASVLVVLQLWGVLALPLAALSGPNPSPQSVASEGSVKSATTKPNVVEIQVDDADKSLLPYMENVNKLLVAKGTTLTNYNVEQSLCCTSRATGFTGMYSHNSKVVGNNYPLGGFGAYLKYDVGQDLPVWLQQAGYQTAFLGKYFNGYPYPEGNPDVGISKSEVPPGWDKWVSPVDGRPYGGKSYKLNVNGKVDTKFRSKFLTDTLSDMTANIIKNSSSSKPFYVTVRPYTPHVPYAYPERFKDSYKNLKAPRDPSYNEKNISDKPAPYGELPLLTKAQRDRTDSIFRQRVRGMLAVDEMVGNIVKALRDKGQLSNTYIMFYTDNGYEMGQHRLEPQKYTQFKGSIQVPFIIRGPGIPGNKKSSVLASNIDIAPTIAAIAGVTPSRTPDGLSLLSYLKARDFTVVTINNRRYILIGRGVTPTTKTGVTSLDEPTESVSVDAKVEPRNFYGVISANGYKLVVYTSGLAKELYAPSDTYELNNLLGAKTNINALNTTQLVNYQQMMTALGQLKTCAGASCTIE